MDEIITMVNIDLGSMPIIACLRGDGNGDGTITVDEINTAVSNGLNGCPSGGTAPASVDFPLEEPIPGSTVAQVIGSAAGAPSRTVTVPVSIRNSGGIVAGTQLDLLYPTALLSDPRCMKSSILRNHTLRTSRPSDLPAPQGMARLRTLLVDLDSASSFDDGPIFKCTFTINSAATPGAYTITGDNENVSDQVGNAVKSTVVSGALTIR